MYEWITVIFILEFNSQEGQTLEFALGGYDSGLEAFLIFLVGTFKVFIYGCVNFLILYNFY